MSEEKKLLELYEVSILNETEILLPPTQFMALTSTDAKTQGIAQYARSDVTASTAGLRVKVRPFS